jgi:hypothetical protein
VIGNASAAASFQKRTSRLQQTALVPEILLVHLDTQPCKRLQRRFAIEPASGINDEIFANLEFERAAKTGDDNYKASLLFQRWGSLLLPELIRKSCSNP